MEAFMSLFWGIVLAGLGAYAMRASFVVLLQGVTFPDRVIRIPRSRWACSHGRIGRDNTYWP
jgi:hypothetical protein